jgi:hypothetical protein
METQAVVKQKTDGFMKQLEQDTFEVLMGVEQKHEVRDQALDGQMDKMEVGIQEAMEQKDKRQRQAKMAIIEGNASKLRQAVLQEEQDLAVAMVGLKEMMESIGLDYTALTEPSADELAIVTRAEAAIRQAEFGQIEAGKSWWRKGVKIARAQQLLDYALSNLETAKTESQRLARSRLMNATLDRSLQHFTTQVARVVDIMTKRQAAIEVQLGKVAARRQQALTMKQQAAAKLTELDTKLNDEMEPKLQLALQELEGLTNGSAEYVAKESEVSQLRNEVENVRGSRNTALALYNSKERFANELQIHETAQRKLRDNQRIWIAVLKSDTQERLVTFASRLEAMKGMSDQQVAKGMDEIGTEIDGRNAETMARVGATSDKVRQEMFEAQPARVKRILSAMGAQQEAIAQMREREQAAMAEYHRRYGVDPKAESFFSFGKGDSSSAA